MVNYCGVRADLLPYVADLSEHKQGRYMPGSRIPVYSTRTDRGNEAGLRADPRLESEGRDHAAARAACAAHGTRFVTPVPHVEVHA